MKSCCEGFTKSGRDGSECVPLCVNCEHGTCTAPFTCQCQPGYTGIGCRERGCPRGTWGETCQFQCSCSHGGLCTQVDGSCQCQPGYSGSECQTKCPPGTFGKDCSSSCVTCQPGYFCHHITGDCMKCDNNTFGEVTTQLPTPLPPSTSTSHMSGLWPNLPV